MTEDEYALEKLAQVFDGTTPPASIPDEVKAIWAERRWVGVRFGENPDPDGPPDRVALTRLGSKMLAQLRGTSPSDEDVSWAEEQFGE